MSSRIYNFHGSQDEYIAFLEAEVLRLRQWHCRCGRSIQETSSELPRQTLSQDSNPPLKDSGLRIEQWKPRLTSSKRPRSDNPPWKRHAAQLVEMIPTAREWRQIMEEKGLYQAMRTGAAVAYLLGNEHNVPIVPKMTESSDTAGLNGDAVILGRITTYAQIAARRQENASLALMLANFQKFVVLSACVVVTATRKIPPKNIFDIVRTCLGSASDDYCRRMLHTAKYINTLIDTLAIHGWDGRAAELFLLCRLRCICIAVIAKAELCSGNRNPAFYYNLARSPHDSLEHIKTALSKPHFTASTETWPKWNSFFVPGVVSQVIQKQIQWVQLPSHCRFHC